MAVRRTQDSVQWRDASNQYLDDNSHEPCGALYGRVADLRDAAEDRWLYLTSLRVAMNINPRTYSGTIGEK